MFSDVLVALRRVPELEGIIVVSGDRVAQRIAEGHGATVVEDDERGHNSAVGEGIRTALEDGIERVLLVPGDCPLLDPKELDELLNHRAGERSALIVPDRHGTGTNALLLTPPDLLAPASARTAASATWPTPAWPGCRRRSLRCRRWRSTSTRPRTSTRSSST